MSRLARTRRRGAPPGTCLFGVETEYAFAALGAGGERLPGNNSVARLMGALKKRIAHLPCTGEHDVFTANGSRVYIDAGHHPEVATPECTTPEEAVLFTRAGDRLLAEAARDMQRAWRSEVAEAALWKANVDHRTGATWASHESYLHMSPQSLLGEQLITHLVTRTVYTGAGGFDNRAAILRLVVSPRAFHLEQAISGSSTCARGIFHTRDEPLADEPYRRLHVLAGESLWSQTADYLRVGATALLVAQIDAGRRPQSGLDLASPLEALRTIAGDLRCTATVRLGTSERLTAIAIQRRLLENVEADLGAPHLPSWAPAVCERWRFVLDGLEASPSSLIGVLDWPTKCAVLERQCETDGIEWRFSSETGRGLGYALSRRPRGAARRTALARLLETDMRFNRLDDGGIFAALDAGNALAHRIVSAAEIDRALRKPPAVGRARMRATYVRKFAAKPGGIRCHWDRVVDRHKDKVILLGDPFVCERGRWTALQRSRLRSAQPLAPALQPIARAFAAGRPREALRQMRALLVRPEQVSPPVYRYCREALAGLVPIWPVPVLRRGSATAGPVLELLLEHVARQGDYSYEHSVGTLLYRYHEGRGQYDRATQVIETLLERARGERDDYQVAVLTNNLGYVHSLAGRWKRAETLFAHAIELYRSSGSTCDVVNARANLLEARFAQTDPERWHRLLPMLREVNRELFSTGDWRARKTLRLLARVAQHRGRRSAARGWARRAVEASKRIPTQLREWDRACLHEL